MTFYIVGAGGLGRETLDALRVASPSEAESAIFLDEHLTTDHVDAVPVRRPDEVEAGRFVVAIADPMARCRLVTTLLARGHVASSVIHPRSVVSAGAAMGVGCVILANAFVSTGVVLGAHIHVNYNATIGHDAVLNDFVTVLPGANVAGSVSLNSGVTVGSNACILQGLRVEANATIGAGSVVTRDLPDGAVVIGIPARPLC